MKKLLVEDGLGPAQRLQLQAWLKQNSTPYISPQGEKDAKANDAIVAEATKLILPVLMSSTEILR